MLVRGLLVLLAIVSSIADAASPPKPTKSEYLESTSAGITFGPDGGAFYLMSFAVVKPVSSRIYVAVTYDNPENAAAPLYEELNLNPGAKEIRLQSMSFRSVTNNHRYAVELALYADSQHQQLLGKHRQEVLFSVPRGMVKMIEQQYPVTIR